MMKVLWPAVMVRAVGIGAGAGTRQPHCVLFFLLLRRKAAFAQAKVTSSPKQDTLS